MAVDPVWRAQRLRHAKWRRIIRWEFWPTLPIYLPVIPVILFAAVWRRSLRCVLVSNPAMPSSGLVEDSKSDILEGLRASGRVADFITLDAEISPSEKFAKLEKWMEERGLSYPVVLKPDAGERGRGVVIAKDEATARETIDTADRLLLAQEFVPGVEYGVFYERKPGEKEGRVTGLTLKDSTIVVGDGERTLEELILVDERAVCLAPIFLELQKPHLHEVPNKGARVKLNKLGTHSQGSLFLDATSQLTRELEQAIDEASRSYEGFYVGRYDVRVPDEEVFWRGEGWKIVELNGVASEPTHMYDPKHSVFYAWRTLAAQWWRAFRYGAANMKAGHNPPTLKALFARLREHRDRLS